MRRIFENKKIVGIYNEYFDYLKITFLVLLIIDYISSSGKPNFLKDCSSVNSLRFDIKDF